MSIYGRLFASVYDRALAATEEAGLAERRRGLLAGARRRVLELGAGTGLNLTHYPEDLEQLVLTEPEEPMLARLRARAAALRPDATVVAASAERLPFPGESFDTVVATLTFCTVGDIAAALDEVRRVVAPRGRLLFLEHVRSEDGRVALRQDLLRPVWQHVGHGCHPNRPTVAAIEAAAFEVRELEHGKVPKAPRFLAPLVVGVAVKGPSPS